MSDAEMDKYASIAGQAYETSRQDTGQAVYMPKLSTDEIAVYQDKHTNQFIVSVRGTVLNQGFGTTAKDLSTDALIALGMSKHSSRTSDARKVVQSLSKKVGKKNVVVTGHSLGGTIARDVSDLEGVRAVTFNAGSSPADFLSHREFKTKKQANASMVTNYSVEGDFVSQHSNLGSGKNVKVPRKLKKKSTHTIHQFTKESYLTRVLRKRKQKRTMKKKMMKKKKE
jgi:hypothetical protein